MLALRQIPNIITLIRILLIVPLLMALLEGQAKIGLWLFLIASVSDGLDGFLARRFGWTSRFGSIIDPIADKAILAANFSVLWYLQQIPTWLCLLVVGRDIWIMLGAAAYHFLIGTYQFNATLISKWNTFLQLIFIGVTLIQMAYHCFSPKIVDVALAVVALTTIVSLIDYTLTWGRRAYQVLSTRIK